MKHYLSVSSLVCLLATSASQAVIINEIDYDQPGADQAEFIELYNNNSASLMLDNFSLQLINGGDGSVYRSIDLSGFSLAANAYFVICDNPGLVANCNYAFTSSPGWLQNGAPDAVALMNGSVLVDALSYEGELLPYSEGSADLLADSNTIITSLARIQDGFTNNDTRGDFQLSCLTPGSANSVGNGSGDCSQQAVSAVPVPAAIWLFASGMLGLIGVSRKSVA